MSEVRARTAAEQRGEAAERPTAADGAATGGPTLPRGIVLDALREADAPRCAALERVLFPGDDPWSPTAFRDELRAGHTYLAARFRIGAGPGATVPSGAGPGRAGTDEAARRGTVRGLGEAGGGSGRGTDGAVEGTAHELGGADTAASGGTDLLVGYAGIAFVARPPRAEAEIHTLGVDPAFHGRGVGRALLAGLLAVADREHAAVFLEVRTDNEAAQALYRGAGFAVVGLRRRYYRPSGADAHTMRRDAR